MPSLTDEQLQEVSALLAEKAAVQLNEFKALLADKAADQLQEMKILLADKAASLTTLSAGQRAEIDALYEVKAKAVNLSPAQKWEVGLIVATLLGGSIALFGTAGVFFVKSAAETIANRVAVDTKQDLVAGILKGDPAFKQDISAKISPIPKNAIAAFDVSTGCPDGWSEYANGRGRTIVGAGQGSGLTARAYQAIGGSEQLRLSIDQLPPHNFTAKVPFFLNPAGDRYDAGGRNYPVVQPGGSVVAETNTLGKGDPIDTMPPYVVLFYCKKD
ncbi:hypothetical protein [Bradyrhizobium cosmicum]|uniref:hypothetical protein n=1 Tax=Bradyrhizobium cosmicum TaxID=1404864 RepID=UPI0011653C45|nr:hypothetical protein [Bradyrhizobium cosmicum]QDP21190.1 hypothetical protein FNV92_02990 [Bradyrhizobium cosmicum]